MSAHISSYTVDPSSTAWTPGPMSITNTQTLIVRASGYAQWAVAPLFSQVEGSYPGAPQEHVLHQPDASKPNPAAPVTNVPGLSMAILAVSSGTVPDVLTPGLGRADALVPRWSLDADGVTRVATFFPSDMANKTQTYGPWDIFFGYVDGNYADNSGSFSVTTIVTNVDLQPAPLLSLPGHMTEDDIDRAQFCSASGLLTPGNRLRSIDGRMVADIFAPRKESGPRED